MNRPLMLAMLTGTMLVPAAALSQAPPAGVAVTMGHASIGAPVAGASAITQTSDRAIIAWKTFDIGANNRIDVAQPSATAALLNRVTGAATSTIAWQLNANGRVFLVDPNGILITSTGTVKTAGFVASMLDTSNTAFMSGRPPIPSSTLTLPSALRAGTVARISYADLLSLPQFAMLADFLRSTTADFWPDLSTDWRPARKIGLAATTSQTPVEPR